MKFLLSFTLFSLLVLNACSSGDDKVVPSTETREEWTGDAQDILDEFIACKQDADAPADCQGFTGQMMDRLYALPEVKDGDKYMAPKKLAQKIEGSEDWEEIGKANQQDNLDRAVELAGRGFCVVAIDDPFSNLAIIIEGELVNSGSWDLMCPQAISLFHGGNYGSSFIGNGINYSFSDPASVTLHNRLYRDQD